MQKPIAVAALLALIACSSPEEMSDGVGVAQARAASVTGETARETLDRRTAPEAEPMTFRDDQKNGAAARDFAYSWPREASAIPGLAARLRERRDADLAAQKSEWEQSIAEFATEKDEMMCVTCVNRSYAMSWSVVADTPRFLELVGERFTYTGGAHGNSVYDAILWDREAGEDAPSAMRPVDLFVDEVALENTAYGDYCAALNRARSERRGLDPDAIDPLTDCPSVSELIVTLTASDGERFDGVSFLAAPYVAGSFAEGPYQFAIPVSSAILEAVKPEYREAFALEAGRSG